MSSDSHRPPGVPRASAGSLPGPQGPLPFRAPLRGGEAERRQGEQTGLTTGHPSPSPSFPSARPALDLRPPWGTGRFLISGTNMPPSPGCRSPSGGLGSLLPRPHRAPRPRPCTVLPATDTRVLPAPQPRENAVGGAADAPGPAAIPLEESPPVRAQARRGPRMAPPRAVAPEGQRDSPRQRQPLRSCGRSQTLQTKTPAGFSNPLRGQLPSVYGEKC